MIKRLALIVFLLAAIGALSWYYTREEPIAVQTYMVARGQVASRVANTRVGTIKACRRGQLAPASAGQVANLPVQEGDRVAKDQVLLEVWNEDLKAQLHLAEMEASAAQARAKESCLVSAGAEREADRLRRLQQRQLVSEEKVDLAVTEADSKAAACQAVREQTRVSAARIAVVRSQLQQTILRAPFAGIVAEINAELGEYVTPSPPGIATLPALDLIDSSCLYVAAPIDEVDAATIETGMSACVTLDAFPGKRCSGFVRRIAPYVLEIEKQARTVEIEVELKDPADRDGLLPGYSADVEVTRQVHEDTLRLPTEALLDENRVLVVDDNSQTLTERSIEIGLSNWEFTEVLSGLSAGEQIVVSVGRTGVEAGALVTPE